MNENSGLFGIACMAGAVIWFVLGWMAGYIYFYPPVLFVVGLATLIRARSVERVLADKPGSGCVACGEDVTKKDGIAACTSCGYEGLANGGGALTASEIEALMERRSP